LEFVWSLELGFWNFLIGTCLELGAWFLEFFNWYLFGFWSLVIGISHLVGTGLLALSEDGRT
jgi:hypothetical protein